jgi:hypothetical protein
VSERDVFCVYETRHPSGFYYVGKSSVRRVRGGYRGSGVRLRLAMTWPGFEPATWTTTIVAKLPSEEDAFDAERAAMPLERLADPFCLNDTPGGRSMRGGSGHGRLLKAQARGRREARRAEAAVKTRATRAKADRLLSGSGRG